ncbi:transposase [Streptomyces sp. NPDC057403]|uniref:transposase n=1 Tax=Streptomyces sp. NPDC057403 TaxID=3346119 RepID=UPI0036762178
MVAATRAQVSTPNSGRGSQGPSSKIIRVGDHGVVVRRHELTEQERELLAPLIPRAATTGRSRVEDRQVINGMVYTICTGISWRDLPERYRPWKTVCACGPWGSSQTAPWSCRAACACRCGEARRLVTVRPGRLGQVTGRRC